MVLDHEAKEVFRLLRAAISTFFNLKGHEIGVCIIGNDVSSCRRGDLDMHDSSDTRPLDKIETHAVGAYLSEVEGESTTVPCSEFVNDLYRPKSFKVNMEFQGWFVQTGLANAAEVYASFRE